MKIVDNLAAIFQDRGTLVQWCTELFYVAFRAYMTSWVVYYSEWEMQHICEDEISCRRGELESLPPCKAYVHRKAYYYLVRKGRKTKHQRHEYKN